MDKIVEQIFINCRDWHLSDQNERQPEVGELLRAFLIAADFIARQSSPQEYAKKVDSEVLANVRNACHDGGFDSGHAAVQMVYARTLWFFALEFRAVAQMLAPAHSVLTSVLRKSEAFYQSQPDPL